MLIVDDHELFRHGLAQVLAAEPDLDVVGEAPDGTSALELTSALVPDVVVMDVRMPGVGGIEAVRRLRAAHSGTKILMLTASQHDDDLFAALRAGATGYLLKEVSAADVADAVRLVARGHASLSPSMAAKLVSEFNVLSRRVDDGNDGQPRLTDRELEVLRLVAKGLSNKEIAAELVISQNTVKNHVRNILDKLNLRSRVEAAMFAVRERLVDTA